MALVEIDKAFIEFLENTPKVLVEFLDIIEEFIKIQGEVKLPETSSADEGPRRQRPGDTVVMDVEPITSDMLAAIREGMATAQVKEDAINYVKAFLTGVLVVV